MCLTSSDPLLRAWEVVVVHDFTGGRVACAKLQPPASGEVSFWHSGGCYTEKAAVGRCQRSHPNGWNSWGTGDQLRLIDSMVFTQLVKEVNVGKFWSGIHGVSR